MTELLTTRELKEKLQISADSTISKYIEQGMPVIRLSKNRSNRFEFDKVLEWLRNKTEEAKSK